MSIAYQVMGDGPIDLVMVPGAGRAAIEQVDIDEFGQGLLERRGRLIAGAFGAQRVGVAGMRLSGLARAQTLGQIEQSRPYSLRMVGYEAAHQVMYATRVQR